MAILGGIQIQNYRALRDVTLGKTINSQGTKLPRLMAVVGANGVGKSSLLDALGFIGDCLTEGVESACDKQHRGGFERLRTQGETRRAADIPEIPALFDEGLPMGSLWYSNHFGNDIR